jgi:poly(3-hydroxybutyrate) depolymerase
MNRHVMVCASAIAVALTLTISAQSPPSRASGDQRRQYVFAPTGQQMPYRVYVPKTWDGKVSLPIILMLHGAGANEGTYLEQADGLLMKLAEQHGYIVVSPLGFTPLGAYGNPLRLPAVFGQAAAAASQRAAVTPARQRELDLSELEVMTALEIVTEEYGADRSRTYLAGHSMGSGGAWHLAARYPERWRAVAPMSGPFVDEMTYPFDRIRRLPIFMTEGTGATPSLEGSRVMARYMRERGFAFEYLEVDGNHGSMVPMVWPRIFEFFNRQGQTPPPSATTAAQAPQEIRLWPGKAQGSEQWTVPEATTTSPTGDRTITNVSDPTVTVFLPTAERATGTAVVVAPGGALRLLGWDNEGVRVAHWLNSNGIAALVLKYRTLQTMSASGRGRGAPPPGLAVAGGAPRKELEIRNGNANPEPDDPALREVLHMGIADAQQALRLARRNAAAWRIDPARIGIMGFSAGGGIAVGTSLAKRSDASPDFLVSLYGPSLQDVNVPAHAPPLFVAVGSSHFNVTNGCLALFAAWKAAGKPAEIHVYDQISAGFGMTKRGLPVDSWNDRLLEWLTARKLR